MPRLSEEEINEVRNRADIVDVITNYVPVQKKGRNYVCVCPFHDDHAPSMQINVDKQIYKCFACGAGGNVFRFVANIENLSFVESVYKVAQIAHVEMKQTLPLITKNENPHLKRLYDILSATIQFSNYQLLNTADGEARTYLHKRGINEEIIKKFELGYNPNGNVLCKFLQMKKFDDESMMNVGVVNLNSYGLNDVFKDRIMIPIHDAMGHPIGFSARRLHDDGSAKYINTNDNELYHKGNTIYNYHRVKEVVRKQGCVYLVEGAMDVISFAKAGIDNVVATLGTAFTKQQLHLLKQLGGKVILAYDGDQAGKNATYKFGKMAIEEHLNFEIVDNRYGLDGDEIIDAYGLDEFKAMCQKTIDWCEFLFQFLPSRYQLDNYSQKKEFALKMQEAIESLREDFEKNKYYLRLKELTGFDMQVSKIVNNENKPQREFKRRDGLIHIPKSGKAHAEYEILSQMLCGISACNYYKQNLGFLLDDTCNKLALYIVDYYRSHQEMDISLIIDYIKEEQVVNLLLDVSNWELARKEVDETILEEAIHKMKICMLDDQIKNIDEQIKQLSDPLIKAQYALKKNQLIQERNLKSQIERK